MKHLIWITLLATSTSTYAAGQDAPVQQGQVAIWSGMSASECGIFGLRYPAVDGTCIFPIGMEAKPAVHEIALWDQDGTRHFGHLEVTEAVSAEVELTLPKEVWDTFVNISDADLQSHFQDREAIRNLVFKAEMTPPRFTLPLTPPADPLPNSADDFASRRTFVSDSDQPVNHGAVESRHSGRDWPLGLGTPVSAPADGTVLLAADQFMTSNSVYIDHGDGLISMFLHLSELSVATGDSVERGQTLGKVGSGGRSTGPHLHVGFLWLDQVIDPLPLFQDPKTLAQVGLSGGEPAEDDQQQPLESTKEADELGAGTEDHSRN